MKRTMALVVLVVTGCTSVIGAIFQRDSMVNFKVIDYNGNTVSNATAKSIR